MKTAEQIYDICRKDGFTQNITSNPDPEYRNMFYQEIFYLMERYASYKLELAINELHEDNGVNTIDSVINKLK